jgi:predicted AAA+ superfamily ATPase
LAEHLGDNRTDYLSGLIKSPKLYFVDSGLACHLLGIETEKGLNQSPFLGPVFEGFVAAEILKQQIGSGRPRALYYFRDQQGLEVDFIVPAGDRRLFLSRPRHLELWPRPWPNRWSVWLKPTQLMP